MASVRRTDGVFAFSSTPEAGTAGKGETNNPVNPVNPVQVFSRSLCSLQTTQGITSTIFSLGRHINRDIASPFVPGRIPAKPFPWPPGTLFA